MIVITGLLQGKYWPCHPTIARKKNPSHEPLQRQAAPWTRPPPAHSQ